MSDSGEQPSEFKERPWICLIDTPDTVEQALKDRGHNCISGTLGPIVELPPRTRAERYRCLPNAGWPENLHAFDIVVVDMRDRDKVPYDPEEHQSHMLKGTREFFILCEPPQTVFDPRAFSGLKLYTDLKESHRDLVIIVFGSRQEIITYNLASRHRDYLDEDKLDSDNYGFLPEVPKSNNRTGVETQLAPMRREDLIKILSHYNDDFQYQTTFAHPKIKDREQGTYLRDPYFFPLVLNRQDEIVAYAHFLKQRFVFVFPQLHREEKADFLLDLIEEFLPSVTPELFPYSTRFAWLADDAFALPNQRDLMAEKAKLQAELDERLAKIESEIAANYQAHQFLHNLLTQSGSELVKTVEGYLRWLEFEKVVNVDEVEDSLDHEDLQATIPDGFLVIEVKGITGTSTDEDCAQVSKYRSRRMRERGRVDVRALYIVNHQRYLPPELRQNPPFTDEQIRDATDDDRGLLTTYQLFKLYFAVSNGFITKEDARNSMLRHGLVAFEPSNAESIGRPSDLHYGNEVGIFEIDDMPIARGAAVLFEEDGRYREATVLSIQVDDEQVEEVSTGELGIKFSGPLARNTVVWILR